MAYLVEGPARVSGDRKIQVQGQIRDILGRVSNSSVWLDLREAVAHEPYAIDKKSVGWPLNFEVTEEGVRPEQSEYLV